MVLCGYLGAAAGDIVSGGASQWLRSRRKVVAAAIVLLGVTLAALLTLGGRGAAWFYGATAAAGFATGYWAVFVTVAGESFGTNLRATVATAAPAKNSMPKSPTAGSSGKGAAYAIRAGYVNPICDPIDTAGFNARSPALRRNNSVVATATKGGTTNFAA